MITKRLAILFVVLLGGLSGVFALPKQVGFQPVGIALNLPEHLGDWWGRDVAVTQLEHEVLGPETEFARKLYDNARGTTIQASVVLAGQDMMTGLHRPERCLAAQGWTFGPESRRAVEIPGQGRMEAMRLRNHKTAKATDGRQVEVENLCYYWFAGSQDLTPSHMERVWIDSRDRLFGGYAQRWAMIMVSADITAGYDKFGHDEKATDQIVQDFVRKLAPVVHKPGLRYR